MAMHIPSRSVPWIIAAVMLFFLGVLSWGLYDGVLTVPSKGTRAVLNRSTNPAGFYALAGFYAVLAGLSAWLLIALLRVDANPAGALGIRRTSRGGASGPDDGIAGRIHIEADGPSGHVFVEMDSGTHRFWWEFGGNDCVALVSVPTPAQWSSVRALAPHPREPFLLALAENVRARRCPSTRIELTDEAILFREP